MIAYNIQQVYFRGWLAFAFAMILICTAVFMIVTRLFSQGNSVDGVKVLAPPAMSTMEQLLAVQNAISQAEGLIQDGNIVLLKFRALLLYMSSQVFISILTFSLEAMLP